MSEHRSEARSAVEQQAADIIAEKAWEPAIHPAREYAAALSRAGLLVTERDVLCRKLAEAMEVYATEQGGNSRRFLLNAGGPARDAVYAAWEDLARYDREHAAKPRYVVEDIYVKDTQKGVIVGMGDGAQNSAMCAALNALAEKEAGR